MRREDKQTQAKRRKDKEKYPEISLDQEKSQSDKEKENKNSDTTIDSDSSATNSDNFSFDDDEESSWISWFCRLKGNEFFCEVEEEYIQDDFNLTGLSSTVPNYEHALDLILDQESGDTLTEEQQTAVEASAVTLYGLIHARYILTSRGIASMLEKFKNYEFGRCPRVLCQGQAVLPVGQSDLPRNKTVKLYCPRCQEIYFPKLARHAHIDGAFFGTTFPHLLLQMNPEAWPPKSTATYIPKIYGFKIHKSSWQVNQQSCQKNKAKENNK